jgi:hypothetical protein
MSTAGPSRKRSPRDRERDIRGTRTEGARRAIRARHARGIRDDARSFGRQRDLGQPSLPRRRGVVRFAERVRRFSRSGTDGPASCE